MLGSPRARRRLTGALALLGALIAGAAVQSGATPTAAAAPASPAATTATHHVLFDNTKAETAGNADWIISTSQPDPLGQDSTPSAETDWTGALSSWGVALQKTGQYALDTLPSGHTITYGNSTDPLDLSHFDTFVLPEPNVLFSSAEKAAIMHFVQNGGGLFLISDHNGSDRNNDGADSVKVINDLLTNNGVDNTDPFGFSVDVLDISSDHPKAISDSTNPVLNGAFGHVTGSLIADGTTFTLKPGDNPNVKGLLWRTGYSSSGTTGAAFATSTFGSGRVAIWGDSSPIDDGTGQSGNTLYDGWNDTSATDAALALNATAWLAGAGTTGGGGTCTPGQILVNPGFESGSTGWSATSGVITNSSSEPAHSGSYKAWLNGYGSANTDTLAQTVTIPAGCRATFTYWLHVDTAETTTTTAYDTLKLQILNSSGTVLATVGSYSNLNAGSGYSQHTLDLSAYAGQTITLKFTGTEGSQLQTSFVVDDTALNLS
jgi:hypothetical protein